jgi:hypothetical protein
MYYRGWVTGLLVLFNAVPRRGASLEWVESLTWSSCLGWRPPFGCAVAEIFVGYTRPCLRMVGGWRYPSSGVGAVLWQSGWGFILPVWPCLGVSSDGAKVSPHPSCLSLQYLCCSSLCRGLGSVFFKYLEYFSCLTRCPVWIWVCSL